MSKLINTTGLSRFWTNAKDYIDTALANKVSVEAGKGLSTNDLTDALKTNYDTSYTHSQSAHAPSDAQANVIESVTVNGTTATVTNKAIAITVPTTVAEMSDAGNYALKSELPDSIEIATEAEIDALFV